MSYSKNQKKLKAIRVSRIFFGLAFLSSTVLAHPPTIVGKNGWLYTSYESFNSTETPAIDESLSLIGKFNKVLAANGITLAFVAVPLKMRIYSEYLPDNQKINKTMLDNYTHMSQAFKAKNVNFIDLNTAFLNNPKRNSDTPLFLRLDTHWSGSGALLAAETIKAGIDSTPVEAYKLDMSKEKKMGSRDLVAAIPPPAPKIDPERTIDFKAIRVQSGKSDLLSNSTSTGVVLVGSSYSQEYTGFASALRYTLQRDVLSEAINADKGSWYGIEGYLHDDAFQTKPPKLLIWEMPERDMRAPPNFQYREARYTMDNSEWLLKASAWVQTSCKPSSISAKITSSGLGGNTANIKNGGLVTGPTKDEDFVEISFNNAIGKMDYLSARISTPGSVFIKIEGFGSDAAVRKFTMTSNNDNGTHALKTPLFSTATGITKIKIYPGKTSGFSFQNLQICRQPDDLLS